MVPKWRLERDSKPRPAGQKREYIRFNNTEKKPHVVYIAKRAKE